MMYKYSFLLFFFLIIPAQSLAEEIYGVTDINYSRFPANNLISDTTEISFNLSFNYTDFFRVTSCLNGGYNKLGIVANTSVSNFPDLTEDGVFIYFTDLIDDINHNYDLNFNYTFNNNTEVFIIYGTCYADSTDIHNYDGIFFFALEDPSFYLSDQIPPYFPAFTIVLDNTEIPFFGLPSSEIITTVIGGVQDSTAPLAPIMLLIGIPATFFIGRGLLNFIRSSI